MLNRGYLGNSSPKLDCEVEIETRLQNLSKATGDREWVGFLLRVVKTHHEQLMGSHK